MSPNNVVTEAAIHTQSIAAGAVNAELAEIMRGSVGDPVFKFAHHGEDLAAVLADDSDPRVKTLRDAMLVAVHTYAVNATDAFATLGAPEANERQLERFNLNRATSIYGPVYVSLHNALRALQEPNVELELQPRVRMLLGTLQEKAKAGSFSSDLLAQANAAAIVVAEKGAFVA